MRKLGKERARRVYTINDESRYLIVENVPALGVTKELLDLFSVHGKIEEYGFIDDHDHDRLTDVYWLKFRSLPEARVAKRKADDSVFFHSVLAVRYAPQFESKLDVIEKLRDRQHTHVRLGIHLNARRMTESQPSSMQLHSSESIVAMIRQIHTRLAEHSNEAPALSRPGNRPTSRRRI
ncbi:uncharacterized protein BJ171DRAFT_92262 [Polychytrium aggregatum]|uniref:uncharacterized protein n=1 Tax=Polychytrium aggregatum TaxID=110093 RepID=UPI0022FDBF63|nr:uncharacterized protein BJ171DRAFT_92262 [Polychytrium aggregatum]KAI9204955.1 hypothetical protein BJ171DRAFT_92262 [Polychytrium aggregatum]